MSINHSLLQKVTIICFWIFWIRFNFIYKRKYQQALNFNIDVSRIVIILIVNFVFK